jgi:hypothetical protein
MPGGSCDGSSLAVGCRVVAVNGVHMFAATVAEVQAELTRYPDTVTITHLSAPLPSLPPPRKMLLNTGGGSGGGGYDDEESLYGATINTETVANSRAPSRLSTAHTAIDYNNYDHGTIDRIEVRNPRSKVSCPNSGVVGLSQEVGVS